MEFEKAVPLWDNKGIEPSKSKRDIGFQEREQAIVGTQNWLQNRDGEAIEETREKIQEVLDKVMLATENVKALRYTRGYLEYFDGYNWKRVTKQIGQGDIPTMPVSFLKAEARPKSVALSWSDPSDTIIDVDGKDTIFAEWDHSIVLRKTTGYSINENDGVIVLTNSVEDQYRNEPFIDTDVEANVRYYYSIFTKSKSGHFGIGEKSRVTCVPLEEVIIDPVDPVDPVEPVIFGVEIDHNNTDPTRSVTYIKKAKHMIKGNKMWDETEIFKDIRPCMHKEGLVQYYLDPNNYDYKASGQKARRDGSDGIVMIEVPVMGMKISVTDDKTFIEVTRERDVKDFYYPMVDIREVTHYNYIGAHLASFGENEKGEPMLDSAPGKLPATGKTKQEFKELMYKNPGEYHIPEFTVHTLLQCLFIIRFGTLDSQSVLGTGRAEKGIIGVSDKIGMYSDKNGREDTPVKFLGIEDFWGNEGYILNSFSITNHGANPATDPYKYSYYIGNGTGTGVGMKAAISSDKVIAPGFLRQIGFDRSIYMPISETTHTGFLPHSSSGSGASYYCDYINIPTPNTKYPIVSLVAGGPVNIEREEISGIFQLLGITEITTSDNIGFRLCY